MNVPQRGGCLCGAVRFTISSEPAVQGICHCRDCQKVSGATHQTQLAVPADGIEITGETRTYSRPADSGSVVTRHFCVRCGCPTHSTNAGMPGMIFLRATHLDDPEAFLPAMEVFTASRPSWGGRFATAASFEKMPSPEAMPL